MSNNKTSKFNMTSLSEFKARMIEFSQSREKSADGVFDSLMFIETYYQTHKEFLTTVKTILEKNKDENDLRNELNELIGEREEFSDIVMKSFCLEPGHHNIIK